MKKKTLIITLFLSTLTFLSLVSPVYARRAGSVYYEKEVYGFPMGGLCADPRSPGSWPRPAGSEAGAPYKCDVVFDPPLGAPNPSSPYYNYEMKCVLLANKGCDVGSPCPPGRHCEESRKHSQGASGAPPSCNPGPSVSSYVQCLECTQQFNDQGEIVGVNECYWREICGDPCALMFPTICPPLKCKIINYDLTGYGPDKGYICVEDPTAPPPGGTGDHCKCKEEVAAGRAIWCPAGQQGYCCPADLYCCDTSDNPYFPQHDPDSAGCCKKNPKEECKTDYFHYYCSASSCPPQGQPARTKLCSAPAGNACCLPEEECGIFTSRHSGGTAYCKNPTCTPEIIGYCAPGLCCTALERCEQPIFGDPMCIPFDCLPGEVLCHGLKSYWDQTVCCETPPANPCLTEPNGYPFCAH